MLWIKEQKWLRAFVLWYSVLRIRWQRLARSGLIAWTDHGQTLGPVENLPLVQQFRHGKMSIERQAMGTDGLALPGQAWRCRAKRREQALGLQRPCRESCAQTAPGAIGSKNLANATPSSSAFATGSRPVSGKNALMCSAASRIWNAPWPTPRS